MERSLLLFLIDRLGGVRSNEHGGVQARTRRGTGRTPGRHLVCLGGERNRRRAAVQDTERSPRAKSEAYRYEQRAKSEGQVGGDCWGPQIGAQKARQHKPRTNTGGPQIGAQKARQAKGGCMPPITEPGLTSHFGLPAGVQS